MGAAVVAAVVVATVLVVVAVTRSGREDAAARPPASGGATVTQGAGTAGSPVIAAVGDIACSPGDPHYNHGEGSETACHHQATSDLLLDGRIARVLALGDLQYETGSLESFLSSYDPTWGRHKSITSPVLGNHEYGTPDAAGYFDYFGEQAGDPAEGYYSLDVGSWHLIALNSNCKDLPVGTGIHGCAEGSPQNEWLEEDLATHRARCTLAFWHHPRWSSGRHGDTAPVAAFWVDLYRAGVDVVLNGHDHAYERFVPQDPGGAADEARGIRQFVVGTGGAELYPFTTTAPATSEVRADDVFGVLEMSLHQDSYDWTFVAEPGESFSDSGTGRCH